MTKDYKDEVEKIASSRNLTLMRWQQDDLVSAITSLVERVQKEAVEQAWQPIETAPVMRTVVLWADTSTPDMANWHMGSGYFHSGMNRWIWEGEQVLSGWTFPPTHWMPLPSPPTQPTALSTEENQESGETKKNAPSHSTTTVPKDSSLKAFPTRHPLAVAWDEWITNHEGQNCADDGILAKHPDAARYLENRLHRAFNAGAKAQAAIKESENHE